MGAANPAVGGHVWVEARAVLTGWCVSSEEAHGSRTECVSIEVSEWEFAGVSDTAKLGGVRPGAAPEGFAPMNKAAVRTVKGTCLQGGV